MTLADILQIEESPFRREFVHVIAIADGVHRVPASHKVPVVLTRSRREDGAYHSLESPSRSVKIDVSVFALHPGLTLLHEVGHFLDHQALNPIKRGFASPIDSNFEELWDLWRTSRLVRKLTAIRSRKRPIPSATTRSFIAYQLLPIELWARTYVQWIVNRSDDLLLLSQFNSSQTEHRMGVENLADYYWDEHDFDRIMPAVDRLMKRSGLI